ncbi:MAG: tetratricopeptide repeat protein [Actinomycetota bacterium]
MARSRREILEQRRDTLLRRLDELEADHRSGELSDDEFASLHDDATVQAAGVLRRLDGQVRRDERADRRVVRLRWITAGAVVVAGIFAGVLVARTAGERLDGGTITGEQIERSSTALLTQARGEIAAGEPLAALELIDEVLERDGDDPDARALRGQILIAIPDEELFAQGVNELDRALALDPEHPEALLFRGAIHRNLGELEEALELYRRLLAVPADLPMKPVVEELVVEIETELAAG